MVGDSEILLFNVVCNVYVGYKPGLCSHSCWRLEGGFPEKSNPLRVNHFIRSFFLSVFICFHFNLERRCWVLSSSMNWTSMFYFSFSGQELEGGGGGVVVCGGVLVCTLITPQQQHSALA